MAPSPHRVNRMANKIDCGAVIPLDQRSLRGRRRCTCQKPREKPTGPPSHPEIPVCPGTFSKQATMRIEGASVDVLRRQVTRMGGQEAWSTGGLEFWRTAGLLDCRTGGMEKYTPYLRFHIRKYFQKLWVHCRALAYVILHIRVQGTWRIIQH